MEGPSQSSRAARLAPWLIVLAVLALVCAVVIPSLDSVTYERGSDDGFYLRYTRRIVREGIGVFPSLFQEYLADEKNWVYPPPSRVGFLAASAAWSKLFGARFATLSYLSLASHLGLVVLVFTFARRHLDVPRALLAAALSAFSALGLGLSRLALTDSFISLSQMAAFCAFYEYAREPQRLRWRVALVASFTLAITTKEIAVLLALPFAAFAVVERLRGRVELRWATTALLLALPVAISVAVWTLAAGSLETLYRCTRIVLLSPETNVYAIGLGSGDWYRYPVDELLMSPLTTVIGLGGVGVALWRWRNGDYQPLCVALALQYAGLVAVLSPFTKNLRYVASLETPLRVLAVVWLWDALSARSARLRLALCTAAVAWLCSLELADYRLVWIHWNTNDPVTLVLGAARGLWPFLKGPDG